MAVANAETVTMDFHVHPSPAHWALDRLKEQLVRPCRGQLKNKVVEITVPLSPAERQVVLDRLRHAGRPGRLHKPVKKSDQK